MNNDDDKKARLRGLYGITDAQLTPDDNSLLKAVESALKGGMRVLQYRNKSLPADVQRQQASALKSLCVKYKAVFIINDSVELARQCNADGVHLGKDDLSLPRAREILGAKAIIGRSCYNQLERAMQARDEGADYVAFGRFFPSKTKPGAVAADIQLIQNARNQLDIPICAIGGITSTNGAELVTQGADMIAVINGLFGAEDIESRAQEFATFFV